MSDGLEFPPHLQASLAQMDARLATWRSELLRLAIEGPGEDVKYEQPLRVWQEHEIWCAILRNHMGALCGYALVPTGHPWWGLEDDHEVPAPRELDDDLTAQQAMDDFGVMPTFLAALGGDESMDKFTRSLASQVQVHGGLTWTGPMPIEGAPWGWWLGFDCYHSGDAIDPAHAAEHSADFNRRMIDEFHSHVWTEDEVAGEVGRLALAIYEAAQVPR